VSEERRPGRPRAADEDRKGHIFAVRLRTDERNAVKAAAAIIGKSPSDWARDILLTEAARVRGVPLQAKVADSDW
jgi:hypothetical protein